MSDRLFAPVFTMVTVVLLAPLPSLAQSADCSFSSGGRGTRPSDHQVGDRSASAKASSPPAETVRAPGSGIALNVPL